VPGCFDVRKEVSMSDQEVEELLSHYGVKGMQWGKSKDRSSTEATVESTLSRRGKAKVKAKGGERHPASADALKVAGSKQKLKKSGTDALSNKELQELSTRMNLEVQVNRLNKETKSSGQKFVSKLIEPPKPKEVRRLAIDSVKKK
jgi:phage gp16-like protein